MLNKDNLIALIESQLTLINLSVAVLTEENVVLDGESLSVDYSHNLRNVLISLFLSAGTSTNTIIGISKLPKLSSVDALPISRAVVEGCINASYILAEGNKAVDNAIAHAVCKGFRRKHISSGKGEHQIVIKQDHNVEMNESLKKVIESFSTKKGHQKNWTELSVQQRIARIGEVCGEPSAMCFNGAYVLVYGDASEVIHGSYYGSLLSYGRIPFEVTARNASDLEIICDKHIQNSFLAAFFSLNELLNVFAMHANLKALQSKVKEEMSNFANIYQSI